MNVVLKLMVVYGNVAIPSSVKNTYCIEIGVADVGYSGRVRTSIQRSRPFQDHIFDVSQTIIVRSGIDEVRFNDLTGLAGMQPSIILPMCMDEERFRVAIHTRVAADTKYCK